MIPELVDVVLIEAC